MALKKGRSVPLEHTLSLNEARAASWRYIDAALTTCQSYKDMTDVTISVIAAFRALDSLVEEFAQETGSDGLCSMSFDMQPTPLGFPSSDPALFSIFNKLWGEGLKDPKEAALIAARFIAQEAHEEFNDDAPVRLHELLIRAAANPAGPECARWIGLLRSADASNP